MINTDEVNEDGKDTFYVTRSGDSYVAYDFVEYLEAKESSFVPIRAFSKTEAVDLAFTLRVQMPAPYRPSSNTSPFPDIGDFK